MEDKSYADKWKDPRWQKRRLQIMERDHWACRICDDETEMLVVHHLQYIPGREPWEYDDVDLVTLCDTHHKEEHEFRPANEKTLLTVLRRLNMDQIGALAIAMRKSMAVAGWLQAWFGRLQYYLESPEAQELVADNFLESYMKKITADEEEQKAQTKETLNQMGSHFGCANQGDSQ